MSFSLKEIRINVRCDFAFPDIRVLNYLIAKVFYLVPQYRASLVD